MKKFQERDSDIHAAPPEMGEGSATIVMYSQPFIIAAIRSTAAFANSYLAVLDCRKKFPRPALAIPVLTGKRTTASVPALWLVV